MTIVKVDVLSLPQRKLRFEDSEVTMRFRLASFFLRRLSTDVISLSRELYRRRGSFFLPLERARSLAAIWVIFCPDFASDRGLLACLLPGLLDPNSVFFSRPSTTAPFKVWRTIATVLKFGPGINFCFKGTSSLFAHSSSTTTTDESKKKRK